MRVLAISDTRQGVRNGWVSVRVALAAGEDIGPLNASHIDIEGIGRCLVGKVRYTDAPEPGLLPGDRVYALEVRPR